MTKLQKELKKLWDSDPVLSASGAISRELILAEAILKEQRLSDEATTDEVVIAERELLKVIDKSHKCWGCGCSMSDMRDRFCSESCQHEYTNRGTNQHSYSNGYEYGREGY